MRVLGIEFGSTRIKLALIDEKGSVLAQGSHEWENALKGGYWTYDLADVWTGVQKAYVDLCAQYGEKIQTLDGIGISAMMHGYLAFDGEGKLLAPFRTWRNTNTAKAAERLTKELGFHMPLRWSASHYYQAVLDGEAHVHDVARLTTLAGYVHYMLTGEHVLGIGDASGMFPIDGDSYDDRMIETYNRLLTEAGVSKDARALFPRVLKAGEDAGRLTAAGAKLLDPSGVLEAGVPLCPPEGDAGTGMVATNAVRMQTGNVSAGTSAFVMIVMERALSRVYPDIDVVTTPAGAPVAMVHVNNFTSEINAWASLFAEVAEMTGGNADKGALFDALFKKSLEGDCVSDGLVGYNFLSGEPTVGVYEGRPMLLRHPSGRLTLSSFMQMQIYAALGAMHMGMRVLAEEHVSVRSICGHGGFFKTAYVGASAMSAALGAPITVMKQAGEGGAWGMAVLALYRVCGEGTLEDFLDTLFADAERLTVSASDSEKERFLEFVKRYEACLPVERLSSEVY